LCSAQYYQIPQGKAVEKLAEDQELDGWLEQSVAPE